VTDESKAAEARRVAVAAVLAAIDGRDQDLHDLLADADRDTLAIAIGGMALAVSAALGEVPLERRAVMCEQLSARGARPTRMPEMAPDEQQRLLIGLLLATHDGDERRFEALVSGISRPMLVVAMRNLAEAVIGWQVAAEHLPGDARAHLAAEALTAADR